MKKKATNRITAIVLAAGKSKRTKSTAPKVLLDLCGKPVIFHILETLKKLVAVDEVILVVGHKKELIKKAVSKHYPHVKYVQQAKLNGTAKAVQAAEKRIMQKGHSLVLCADTPLVTPETLQNFIRQFFKRNLDCSIITTYVPEPNDYGRVIRDARGYVMAIKEAIELSKEERAAEINSGIYCFKNSSLAKGLKKIGRNPKKGEYFLTDIIHILYNDHRKTDTFTLTEADELMGINTQKALAKARNILNGRFLERLMKKGVVIMDPQTTFVSFDTKIGQNSTLYPFTFIEENVIIGNNCQVGPFVHIRKGTKIRDNTKIGNFIELNRSTIATGVRMKHFGYLGDATVQKGTNIGAGTVIANYDGKKKHKTVIGQNAFIGCDTIIIAPAKIGKKAVTGAGSVVTKNVPAKTVVIGVPARPLKKVK